MEDQSIEYELKIEDDYRKSNDNQKQRYFFPQDDHKRISKSLFCQLLHLHINKILF